MMKKTIEIPIATRALLEKGQISPFDEIVDRVAALEHEMDRELELWSEEKMSPSCLQVAKDIGTPYVFHLMVRDGKLMLIKAPAGELSPTPEETKGV